VERAKPRPKPAQRRKRTPKIHLPDMDGAPAAQEPRGTAGAAVVEPVVSVDIPEVEAEASATDGDATDGEATDGEATDGDAPVAKKRTRRGSRGGRNRKRKPAAANGDGEVGAEAVATEPNALEEAPVAEPEEAPQQVAEPVDATAPREAGYVPMSEWIEDFDRR